MKKINFCFLNGKIIKENEAKFGIFDIGIQRGYGIFEVLRTYNKTPFLLEEHIQRLFTSAKKINLKIPYSKNKISQEIHKLLKINKENKDSLIKIIVTGGESQDGLSPGKKPTFLLTTRKLKEPNKNLYTQGVRVLTLKYQRDLPSVKTLNYIELVKSWKTLKKKKAFTLLYIKNKKVLEGATSNIFLFRKNKLLTPKSGILRGITRNLVLRLAKKNFSVEEKDIKLNELITADEVFLTGTTIGILPVVKIDNKTIAEGKPGKNTLKLIKIFNQYTKSLQ